ncbi:hypothetical protein CFOL_v3_12865, partial [Cephalotus follicularis]
RYLGVPLIVGRLGLKDCCALVEQMVKRVRSWACNCLSFGGRLQLISSTLFSMQVFWCKTFVLPVAVINNLCRPKDEGGLGIKSLRAWNKAAILQQGWDIIKKKESIWVQ